MRRKFFPYFLLMLAFSPAALFPEAPWGQDADLVYDKPGAPLVGDFLAGADTVIQFHQRVLSPADGPRSHYIPSSSSYALQAIRRHGLIVGFCMGCDRLLRENSDPWIYRHTVTRDGDTLKLDPIPQ